MEDEICMFVADKTGNFCKILVGEKCDGKNKCCSFRKTEKQLGMLCKLSIEEEAVDNFS